MHTSTERFPFSRRSPSKRRAFLGVFNITKSFGRHDKCQRPRISLQIKRCRPITPPIIRRKHREIPIFCPRSVCRGLRLQNTRKNARRHHPHTARTKTKGRPSFPAHSAGRKSLRRTKCAARTSCMSEDVLKSNFRAGPDENNRLQVDVRFLDRERLREVARAAVTRCDFLKLGKLLRADTLRDRAASVKTATGRRIQR